MRTLVYMFIALGSSYYTQYNLSSSSVIMSNMYGPHDHFEENRSHAMGALIDKIYSAKINDEKTVDIWGTGKQIREWLYVKDGANALIKCLNLPSGNYLFNIGESKGISILDLANLITLLICKIPILIIEKCLLNFFSSIHHEWPMACNWLI